VFGLDRKEAASGQKDPAMNGSSYFDDDDHSLAR
jgi:hypothetical protein